MIPIVEIARILVGRLDVKKVVVGRTRVDGCAPFPPLNGYARRIGAECTLPGHLPGDFTIDVSEACGHGES